MNELANGMYWTDRNEELMNNEDRKEIYLNETFGLCVYLTKNPPWLQSLIFPANQSVNTGLSPCKAFMHVSKIGFDS